MALTAARDRTGLRQALLDHPQLLRKETQDFVRDLIGRITQTGQGAEQLAALEQRLFFLEQCHDVGVEAALDEVPST